MKSEINIIRSRPRVRFTSLPNRVADDTKLSARALGFLYYVLTKPPGWRVIPEQLGARFNLSYRVVLKVLGELADANYLKRKMIYENYRIRGWRYLVTDEPGYFGEADETETTSAQVDEPADQAVDLATYCSTNQIAKRHPVVSTNSNKDPLAPCPESVARPHSSARKTGREVQRPSHLDRGRVELEIAARISPGNSIDGYELLAGLPESEIEQLCTMQRRGTLDDTAIMRLRARALPP